MLPALLGMEILERVTKHERLKEAASRAYGSARERIVAELDANAAEVSALIVRVVSDCGTEEVEA
jgi:uncharacterized membrane-anchored protein YjiN (DUF445 family)